MNHRTFFIVLLITPVMLVVFLSTLSTRSLFGQTTEAGDELKEYLKTHQLYGILASVLENELVADDPEVSKEDLEEVARELADIYAWQLNTQQESGDETGARLDELARHYPSAIPWTTRISVAFGRYRLAREAFDAWILDRENAELREIANHRFSRVVEQVSEAATELASLIHDEFPGQDPDGGANSPRRRELEKMLSQFQFVDAWARYYQSLAFDNTIRRESYLHQAEQQFYQLLEISDGDMLVSLTPHWFSLNSEWTCRLLLGLAMTSQALGKSAQADFSFHLLGESRVADVIRTNQRIWKLHSMIYPGQIDLANTMVRQIESDRKAQDDDPFWSTVAIAGLTWPNRKSDEAANMTRAGLSNLARINQFEILDEVLDRFPVHSIQGDDFFSRWIDGYVWLRKAQNEAPPGPAIKKLKQALELKTTVNPADRARCQYHYGFALYLARDFENAAGQFRISSTLLRQQDPWLAEQAKWMQCQSLGRMTSQDPAWKKSFEFALQEFQQHYPDSQNTSQASFLRIMNDLNAQPPDKAIAVLQAIQPTDANYERALFELCRLSHRQWSETEDEELQARLVQQTIDAASRYIAQSALQDTRNSASRYARACLLAADVLLQSRKPVHEIEPWLGLTRDAMPGLPSDREIAADYHFLVLALAAQSDDSQRELQAADWLLLNSRSPSHTRAALVSKARYLDAVLNSTLSASGTIDARHYDPVIEIYQRLVNEYRDDVSSSRERVRNKALLRLAELQMAAGKTAAARLNFESLYQGHPDELVYILGLARAEMKSNHYQQAASLWRTIASGLSAGDDAWLEAKFNLVLCLQEQRPENARKVMQQVRLLVPNMPEHWQTRFADLQGWQGTDLRDQID